jgi:hypothetical protein
MDDIFDVDDILVWVSKFDISMISWDVQRSMRNETGKTRL